MLAAACWGSLSVTTTIALRGLGPLTLLVGELSVAVLALSAARQASRQRLPRLSWRLAAVGLLEPGLAFLTFNLGVQRTSAAHAGVIAGSETVFVVLLGLLLLKERPRVVALGGVMLAVAGVSLLTLRDQSGNATLLGDSLVLVNAIAGACSVILVARLLDDDVTPLAVTTAQFATGLVVVLPAWALALATGAEHFSVGRIGAASVLALAVTGGLLAGAFLIYAWALGRVAITAAGAALTLIPLVAVVLAGLVLGDPVTADAAASTALIVAGLVIYVLAQGRADPSESIVQSSGKQGPKPAIAPEPL